MLTLVLLWKILSTQMFAVWSNRILVNKSSMVKPVEKLKKSTSPGNGNELLVV